MIAVLELDMTMDKGRAESADCGGGMMGVLEEVTRDAKHAARVPDLEFSSPPLWQLDARPIIPWHACGRHSLIEIG